MASLPSDRYVYSNGIRMHCLDWGGDKPPLITTHGSGMLGATWIPTAEYLEPHFRVIALDLRASGDTDHPTEGYSWLNLAKDVAGFVEGLRLDRKPLMVGHSRGGGCAMLAAQFCAQLWSGVVFIEPTVPGLVRRPGPPEGRGPGASSDQAMNRRSIFPDRAAAYAQYHERGMFKGWTDEYLRVYLKHALYDRVDGQVELKCPPELEAKYYGAKFDDAHPEIPADYVSWLESMRSIKCPTLLAYGQERGVQVLADPPPGVRRFLDITHAETALLPGGHFMMMTYPKDVADLIVGFARRHNLV